MNLPAKNRFLDLDPTLNYLKGNSLGRLPIEAESRVGSLVRDEWGGRLVRGWNEGWYDLPQRLGAKIASLIGAKPHEVLVCDSTSVNLFKLAFAALHSRPERAVLLTDVHNFPSDLYVFQGLRDSIPDLDLRVVEDIASSEFDSDVSLVSVSHVEFKSGRMHDGAALTARAQAVGAWALWDLSHSVGAVEVDLNGWGAEMAVGCCYKYLNGGPGAPAFLYVREDLQEQLRSPIEGWFGHAAPFDFALDYSPGSGLNRFLSGTPPILSMAAVEAGVDLMIEAGMSAVRKKSVKLTELAIRFFDGFLLERGFELLTPRNRDTRGSHVCFTHPDSYGISQALIKEENVVVDFRAPDALRAGFAPLYNDEGDVHRLVDSIVKVIDNRRYESYRIRTGIVT